MTCFFALVSLVVWPAEEPFGSEDVVQLKSGVTLEGSLLRITQRYVIIRADEADRPRIIHREDVGRIELGAPDAGNAAVRGERKQGPSDGTIQSSAMKPRIRSALKRLRHLDPNERRKAKDDLKEIGKPAVPFLVQELYHESPEARAAAADLLGELNAREAIRPLLEAFYAALPEEGPIPHWQVPFLRALRDALPKLTGKNFIDVEPDRPLIRRGLEKYLDWYRDNLSNLPRQIGELAPEPDNPVSLEKRRALRLERFSWPRPELPLEQGGMRKLERPADKAWIKRRFPVVGRETLGGLISEEEQAWADELMSAPGEESR